MFLKSSNDGHSRSCKSMNQGSCSVLIWSFSVYAMMRSPSMAFQPSGSADHHPDSWPLLALVKCTSSDVLQRLVMVFFGCYHNLKYLKMKQPQATRETNRADWMRGEKYLSASNVWVAAGSVPILTLPVITRIPFCYEVLACKVGSIKNPSSQILTFAATSP